MQALWSALQAQHTLPSAVCYSAHSTKWPPSKPIDTWTFSTWARTRAARCIARHTTAAAAASSGQRHQRTAGWAKRGQARPGQTAAALAFLALHSVTLGLTQRVGQRWRFIWFSASLRFCTTREGVGEGGEWGGGRGVRGGCLSSHSICMASILKCPDFRLDIMLHIIYNHMTPQPWTTMENNGQD